MQKYELLLKQFFEIPKFEGNTNYFEITGYSHYENIASNILKFYLNPSNEHGLENLVLKSLLEISDKEFVIGGFNSVKIKREVYTENRLRIDLIIETENYVLVIENKIFHKLNNDLEEYENYASVKYANDKRRIVFLVLSPKIIKHKKEKEILEKSNFKNITYKKLIDRIKKHYSLYAFSANSKYLIFFNEFISSINKIAGMDTKDEKMEEFFLSNNDKLEELIDNYSNFKDKYTKRKVLEIKSKLDINQINGIVKEWIYEEYMLVHDFKLGTKKISIETSVNLKNYRIAIFSKNSEAKLFIESDDFHKLTGINNKSISKGEKLVVELLSIETSNSTEVIVSKLQKILLKMSHGFDNYKEN